jgi:hypothetical protein
LDKIKVLSREKNEFINEKLKLENQIEFNNLQIRNNLETIKELNESKAKLEKDKIEYLDLLKVNTGRDDSEKNEFKDLKNYFDRVC